MALNEEGGTPDSPVLNYSGAPSYTAVAPPARSETRSILEPPNRTSRNGVSALQTWDPTAPCYGKFWADVPGSPERIRRTIPLGVCRTKTVARQRLRDYIQREAINSTETFRQNTAESPSGNRQNGGSLRFPLESAVRSNPLPSLAIGMHSTRGSFRTSETSCSPTFQITRCANW